MRKVYIVLGSSQYAQLCTLLGWEVVDDVNEADTLLFTGGSDVFPALYYQPTHWETYYSQERDEYDEGYFDHAILREKDMVGICRGGQFLNVMNGGSMYQHIVGDTHCRGEHEMVLDEVSYQVRSTHHQAMIPGPAGDLIGYAPFTSTVDIWDSHWMRKETDTQTAEVVWYPDTHSLCFQPHPELYDDVNHPCIQAFKHAINITLEEN